MTLFLLLWAMTQDRVSIPASTINRALLIDGTILIIGALTFAAYILARL